MYFGVNTSYKKIMKLKRCFKTVLSSVLAAAMLITAVPSNLTLDVQAAPAEEVVVETETATEEAVAAEDVAATVEASTEAAEDTTTEAVVEEKEENVEPEVGEDNSAVDTSTGYWGPTIDETGAVTIYYYDTVASSIKLKGGWVSDWSDKIEMDPQTDGEGNTYYAYTLPLEKAPVTLSFPYGFEPDGGWSRDLTNPTGEGTKDSGANSEILRNPVVDADSNVTLYYYPKHGEYPSSVKVQYRVAGSEDAYG